ncbi:MAG: hypothetical protein ACRECO_07185 [Xanthobacteraceae bacterium]
MQRRSACRALSPPRPAALMDERRTLLTFAWIVGGVVLACLSLSAISLAGDTAPVVTSMPAVTSMAVATAH